MFDQWSTGFSSLSKSSHYYRRKPLSPVRKVNEPSETAQHAGSCQVSTNLSDALVRLCELSRCNLGLQYVDTEQV